MAIAGAAVAFLSNLGARIPDMTTIELWLGLGLAVLAGLTVVEAALRPRAWVRLVLALLGFTLAVFYAGFR